MTGTHIIHARAAVVVMSGAEISAARYIAHTPGLAGRDGRGFRLFNPIVLTKAISSGDSRPGRTGPFAGLPGETPVDVALTAAGIDVPGSNLQINKAAAPVGGPSTPQVGANQAAGGSRIYLRPSLRVGNNAIIGIGRAAANLDPDGFPAAAAFLLGEFKDALRGDAGDAVFAVGEPAFLAGGEAAEAALALGAVVLGAVPVVMGVGVVIDLALGPSVGLVKAAIEGFAAVGG